MDPATIANLVMSGTAVALLGLGAWQKRRQAAGKPQLLPNLNPQPMAQPQPVPIALPPAATPPIIAQPAPSLLVELAPIIAQLMPVVVSFLHLNAQAPALGAAPAKPGIDLNTILQIAQQLLHATPPTTVVPAAKAA